MEPIFHIADEAAWNAATATARNIGGVLSVTPFVKDQNGQFSFDE